MIKKQSVPTHPEIFARFKTLVQVFYIASWIGNIFSGFTEWNGFMSDNIPPEFKIAYCILGVLVIEMLWRYLLPILAASVFDAYRKFEPWKIPMILFLLSCCVGVFYLSTMKSKEGIAYKTDQSYHFDSTYTVDSMQYNLLCESCIKQYKSDSANAAVLAKGHFSSELAHAKRAEKSERYKAAALTSVTEDWAVKTRKKKWAIARAKKQEIRSLESDVQSLMNDHLAVAKAAYEACRKNANDTLIYYTNLAKNSHDRKNRELMLERDNKILSTNLFMYAGVILVAFYSFFKEYVNHISGVTTTYIMNPVDTSLGFGTKVRELSKVKLHNLGERIVLMVFGESVEAIDRELKIKKVAAPKKKVKRQKRVEPRTPNKKPRQPLQVDLQKKEGIGGQMRLTFE